MGSNPIGLTTPGDHATPAATSGVSLQMSAHIHRLMRYTDHVDAAFPDQIEDDM